MESRFDNFIAGDWVPGEHYQPNINPSCTSDVIGEYVHASIKQTQSALHAAADAFAVWSTCSIQQRCDAQDFARRFQLRSRNSRTPTPSR